jgi:two-component system chemotaxis sensor kinase CheA
MNLSPEELREVLTIFRAEAVDQIKILNNGLLELEKHPSNQGAIEEIFRTAHSIKGSSRMLGLIPIEQVAHELEDVLGHIKTGKVPLLDHIDIIYESVDKIDEILKTLSTTDQPDLSKIDVTDLVNRLGSILNKPTADVKAESSEEKPAADELDAASFLADEPEKPAEEIQSEDKHEEEPAESEVKEVVAEKVADDVKSDMDEYIRISIRQIDSVMNLVGELVTSKVKAELHLSDLYELKAKINLLYKAFDDQLMMIRDLDTMYQKATESVTLDHLNENEVRNILRLVIQTGKAIGPLNNQISELITDRLSDNTRANNLIDQIQAEVRDTRLLPLHNLFELLPRMVRDISKQVGKKVDLSITGAETKLDKHIIEEIKNPLIHLIRNCVDHGIESPDERMVNGKPSQGKISIKASYEGNTVLLEISDDGHGIDENKIIEKAISKKMISSAQAKKMTSKDIINMIFLPGFSTSDMITDISGRGVGMDVVRTNVENLKGVISVSSEKDKGTGFQLRLPLTLATIEVLILESFKEFYTIPVISINRLMQIRLDEITIINKKNYINIDDEMVIVMRLDDLIQKPRRIQFKEDLEKIQIEDSSTDKTNKKYPVVVCQSAEKKLALIVDHLIDEQEVVIKDLGSQFKRVRFVMGATILGSGGLAMMLDPSDLVKAAYADLNVYEDITEEEKVDQKRRVLVVDDSITTRTLEKNILEQAGFDVAIAVNGQEAWELLAKDRNFDIVVSDVEMPYMTGFELVSNIKRSAKHKHLPCILCTSLESESDRKKGVESGANAYITKGSFNQRNLLETIERLI